MHNQNLVVVDNVDKVIFQPDLFSANNRNIGIFGENGISNTTLLETIVAQAIQLNLPVTGLNISKTLESRFLKWQAETFTSSKASEVSDEVWGIDDDSDKGANLINNFVVRASQFDQAVMFFNDCTPLLKNPKISQYLSSLCANSTKYGLQTILVAESDHDCSQKIIENIGTRFIVRQEKASFE